MQKLYFSLLFLLLLSAKVVIAQNGPIQKLKEAKVEILTNSLNLSPEQSKVFWPMYNEFDDKRSEIRKSIRENSLKINTLTATDEQLANNLKEILSLRQKEIDLEKDYFNRFMKVVSVRQVAELYKTEQKFTQLLLSKLNKRNKE